MSNAFPVTSITLIQKFQTMPPGGDEAHWVRFWDLYAPAMRQFAVWKGGEKNADDIVMKVLEKLVDVLRQGKYDPASGRFHSYLATMISNEVHMQHRKDEVRRQDDHVTIDSGLSETLLDSGADAAEQLDADWQRAVLAAAVEHVLTKSALSDRDRKVYRAYVQENKPIEEVASEFGITRNLVSQIKVRIERRIAAIGRELASHRS